MNASSILIFPPLIKTMKLLKFEGKVYAEEIDIKRFYRKEYGKIWKRSWEEPLILEDGEQKAFVFAFGSIVFLNAGNAFKLGIERKLKKFFLNPKKSSVHSFELKVFSSRKEVEEYLSRKIKKSDLIVVTEEEGVSYTQAVNTYLLKMIALVISQSCALELLEEEADRMIDVLEDSSKKLSKFSFFSSRRILQFLMEISKMKAAIVSDLMLIEKPEITWEMPQLEKVYYDVRDYFEIRYRVGVLNKKINYISEVANLYSRIVSERRGEFLEIIIIVLIALEILLYFFG